jgi:hypothetical protein
MSADGLPHQASRYHRRATESDPYLESGLGHALCWLGGPVYGGTCLYLRGDGFEGYARTTPSASLCKFGPFEGHAFEGYP